MTYAYSNLRDGQEPSYRYVATPEEAQSDELVLDYFPVPMPVWDARSGSLRPKTPQELVEQGGT